MARDEKLTRITYSVGNPQIATQPSAYAHKQKQSHCSWKQSVRGVGEVEENLQCQSCRRQQRSRNPAGHFSWRQAFDYVSSWSCPWWHPRTSFMWRKTTCFNKQDGATGRCCCRLGSQDSLSLRQHRRLVYENAGRHGLSKVCCWYSRRLPSWNTRRCTLTPKQVPEDVSMLVKGWRHQCTLFGCNLSFQL